MKTGSGLPGALPPERADYTPVSGYDPGERVRRKVAELVVRKAGLFPGDRVLDAACGPGLAGVAIARAFTRCRVAGVDARAEVIARARENARIEGGGERFLAARADAGALPFRDEWFRFSMCAIGLGAVEDPVEAIAEVHRVTEFWGKVLLIEPDLSRVAKRPRGVPKRPLDDEFVDAMREMGWGKIQRQKLEVLPGGALLEAVAAKRWDPESPEDDEEDEGGD